MIIALKPSIRTSRTFHSDNSRFDEDLDYLYVSKASSASFLQCCTMLEVLAGVSKIALVYSGPRGWVAKTRLPFSGIFNDSFECMYLILAAAVEVLSNCVHEPASDSQDSLCAKSLARLVRFSASRELAHIKNAIKLMSKSFCCNSLLINTTSHTYIPE